MTTDLKNMQNRQVGGVEALKVFAMVIIVINHICQSLCETSTVLHDTEYLLDITSATYEVPILFLAMLRYLGRLGNIIFFVCSAYFLQDSSKVKKDKIVHLAVDNWIISILLLVFIYILKMGHISNKMILKQFLPNTLANNWFITCYILFYMVHPAINQIIKNQSQQQLFRSAAGLWLLYIVANYFKGLFFASDLIIWLAIYFIVAYMKLYLVKSAHSVLKNVFMILLGTVGHCGGVVVADLAGLYFGVKIPLTWQNGSSSPFLLAIALGLFNLAKSVNIKSNCINYISSLSMLIYVIHDNELIREYYRPLLWIYVYNKFGYDYVLMWIVILSIIVFLLSFFLANIYKKLFQRKVHITAEKFFLLLKQFYIKIERSFLTIH